MNCPKKTLDRMTRSAVSRMSHWDCPSRAPRHQSALRAAAPLMKLTNDSYIILIGTKNFTERYYRDKTGWLKISARGRKFRMTAEQVLNHVLPAIAGLKPNVTIKVEHHDPFFQDERTDKPSRHRLPPAVPIPIMPFLKPNGGKRGC